MKDLRDLKDSDYTRCETYKPDVGNAERRCHHHRSPWFPHSHVSFNLKWCDTIKLLNLLLPRNAVWWRPERAQIEGSTGPRWLWRYTMWNLWNRDSKRWTQVLFGAMQTPILKQETIVMKLVTSDRKLKASRDSESRHSKHRCGSERCRTRRDQPLFCSYMWR